MKISILNTSEQHPINPWLHKWIAQNSEHQVSLIRSKEQLQSGDLLFLISCEEIVTAADREKFVKTLVIHASDLPNGRGWSPHIWKLLAGAEEIVVSLLEAGDKVDTGDIWSKLKIKIPKTALYDEINSLIFSAELQLMDFAIQNFNTVKPVKQSLERSVSYWPKRTPKDSELDIDKTINEQFNLLRVSDPNRFPAFFYKEGKKFLVKIEAVDE
ncbi:hypothetical protein JCM30760_08360 [Thiomicrorhabdus hydrogeniphila]